MKPSRLQQLVSWLLVALIALLMWQVHEAFYIALMALPFIREDLHNKEHTLALAARYSGLVNLAGAYAVLASGAILWGTLTEDKDLASALGTKSLVIVFWPFLILICLYERKIFVEAK